MKQFEVGKVYRRNDTGFDPVMVTRRTKKTVWVRHVVIGNTWFMRVRHDENGNEYAVDYEVPRSYRDSMAFHANNVEEV